MKTDVQLDSIPAELRERPQWVVWKIASRKPGERPTKLPFTPRDRMAASDDPSTWSRFDDAASRFARGGYAGVGFEFAADDPYCGIDLDGCRNPETGQIADWAQEVIDRLGIYAEVSPSKTGVKIFCRAKLPAPKGKKRLVAGAPKVCDKTPAIELYDHGRYFATTGERLPDSTPSCVEAQAAVDAIWQKYIVEADAKKRKDKGGSATRTKARSSLPLDRCRKFVAKLPEAIEGDNGSDPTFHAACECFRFGLEAHDAMIVMHEYNSRCKPEWSDDELSHKLDDAKVEVEAAGEFGSRLTAAGNATSSRRASSGGADSLPEIEIGPDEMRVADETIEALGKRTDLYQRGGLLVEIRESPEPPPCIVRPDGGVRAAAVSKWRLREVISDSARYMKLRATEDGEELVEANVPPTAVEQVLARGCWTGIPPLEGIVTSPQFLRDGSILIQPGYDRRSGLYFADACAFDPIHERPTKADAEAARDALLEVIVDFPCDDVGRAAWLSAVLTGAARHAIDGPTPLYAIDANVRGSGKSKMADSVGNIHTGRDLPRTSAAGDDEEMRKRVTATLLAGDPHILIDNINGVLGCASLDALLTSTLWMDRILGESTMTAAIPAKSIWYATGNNLQFQADTARRTLRIRLESLLENPEERTGFRHENLLAWVKSQRGKLASAAVVILRAWHVAGRPDMGLVPWGSFDAWSGLVRSAVVWVGMADPGASRQQVQRESDREAMLLRMMLDAWQEADPHGHGMTIADALKRAENGEPGLSAVFAELAGSGGKVNPRSVGMKLHHLRGRVCGGRYFDRRDTRAGATWIAQNATGGDPTAGLAPLAPLLSTPRTRAQAHAHTRTREDAGPPGNSPASPASPALPNDPDEVTTWRS